MGYLGVFALIALEDIFPPVPSEIILPLAGYLVGRDRFIFPLVLLAATAGSVTGALVLYALGRRVGEERLLRFAEHYGRYALVSRDEVEGAIKRFERHGRAAVFVGRLLPGVRSLISIPAGIERMSLGRFVVYTVAGSGVWNTVLISLGWLLGDQWERVQGYTAWLQYAVLAAGLALLAWFLLSRWRQRSSA